jgi:ATP-dependent DNA helicase RecG
MDAHSRRQVALDAIAAVRGGALAKDIENQYVDFKEEGGTVGRSGRRMTIGSRDQRAAQALAEVAACMANSDSGAVVVVGVNDKERGKAAFVGTYLDTVWLRERIHALTQPNLSVDVIEEVHGEGRRLYLINVAPALEEVRCGGKLRARLGDDCVELSGDRAREFLERRRNFDWTAQPSGLRFSDADPDALASARRHFEEQRGSAPGSDLALARRLGVTLTPEDDPALTRAGALLLCEFEPHVDQLDLMITTAEGATSRFRERHPAPLILAFDVVWDQMLHTFPAESSIVGAQRRAVRAIPEGAMREALVNALMHRDYRQPHGLVIALATGDPPSALKVRSPGGFPVGVQGDRLLATPSRPRNLALANAFRALGLADTEGVGINTMYRVMLRDGHPEPDIVEDAGDVICRLTGGRVDPYVREFFDELSATDRSLGDDVRVYIAITDLLTRTPLRPDRLAAIAQSSADEALELLERLARVGVVERLLNQSRSFRLTTSAIDQLRRRITYPVRQSIDEHWELVRAYLDVHPAIGREDAAEVLGLMPERASNVLSQLYNQFGRIEPVANKRGRGVRYQLSGSGRAGRPGAR